MIRREERQYKVISFDISHTNSKSKLKCIYVCVGVCVCVTMIKKWSYQFESKAGWRLWVERDMGEGIYIIIF